MEKKNKLVLAVLQGSDSDNTIRNLNEHGFMVTVLSSTGGFLKKKSTTVMIGVEEEDLHIDLNGDAMTISAQRHSQYEEKDQQGNYVRCERSFGSFSRTFDVSGVDTEHVTAAYQNGVLTLEMPKKAEAVPESRRLEIR